MTSPVDEGPPTVYLAHSITFQSASSKRVTKEVRKSLDRVGFRVLDPESYGWDELRGHQIVRRNVRDITSSDLVVAICHDPSFGVGGELVVSRLLGVPVLALVRRGRTVPSWVSAFSDRVTSNVRDLVIQARVLVQ